MKEFRKAKNVKEYYTSLEDMRVAWGLKPVSKKTSDEKKLEEQRERFTNSNRCKACGHPMTFISDSNIMCCTNETCKGIKHQTINEKTGETKVWYTPSYKVLDEKGAMIANTILS